MSKLKNKDLQAAAEAAGLDIIEPEKPDEYRALKAFSVGGVCSCTAGATILPNVVEALRVRKLHKSKVSHLSDLLDKKVVELVPEEKPAEK